MSEPIDVVLHCPQCGKQHIDRPEPENDWDNPPHKSHQCHECGCIWRPADVPTNGVSSAKTRGRKDTWPPVEDDAEKMREAIRAAYHHLDTYGVVQTPNERELESQQKVFDLLRPFVT